MIGFAHRGAPSPGQRDNSLAAFERALTLGARGIETDVGLTADDVPVLLHQGLSLRGSRVAQMTRAALPPHIPTLADLYDRCGVNFDLSLDMAEPRAAEAVVAEAASRGAEDRLWLAYWRLPTLERWRSQWPRLRLVYPTMPLFPGRSGQTLRTLASLALDVINVHHRFAGPGLVEQAHSHRLEIFAWGIRSCRALERVAANGVDGVYCDNVEDMVAVVATRQRLR